MSPAGFEPAIPASRQPQTHSLDRAATGFGTSIVIRIQILQISQLGTQNLFFLSFADHALTMTTLCDVI